MHTPIQDRAVPRRYDSQVTASRAWDFLSNNLACVLEKLEKDQYLILSVKESNRFVQFACHGEEGMRVEVTSNHFLKGKDRLSKRQASWLLDHGWNAPTGDRSQSTAEKGLGGSPNYFIDFSASVDVGSIANLAVKSLVEGLDVPSLAELTYEAFGADKVLFRVEDLGIDPAASYVNPVMERVLLAFRQVTRIADLGFDKDNDVMVHFQGLPIWATPTGNKIRLFSLLVEDVAETPALLHRVNEINAGVHGARCVCRHDKVFALTEILASPFVCEHFETTINEFSEAAKSWASQLIAEFAGDGPVESAVTATIQ